MSLVHLTAGKEDYNADSYTVVVDGRALDLYNTPDEVLTPRAQVEILQNLVKIQREEKWDIWVLFNGESLRQVEHGGDFMGLRVFFSPTPPQRIPTLLECIRVLAKKGRKSLLITNDVVAEARALDLGALTLRGDTLRKGYEDLFAVRHRPQSRLLSHRTRDMDRDRVERERTDSIRGMIDVVE